jgi:hypothetical protein
MDIEKINGLTELVRENWDDSKYAGRRVVDVIAKELGLYHGVGSYMREERKVLYSRWKESESLHGVLSSITNGVVFLDTSQTGMQYSGLLVPRAEGWHIPNTIEGGSTADIFEQDGQGVILERLLPQKNNIHATDIPDITIKEAMNMTSIMDCSETYIPADRWRDIGAWLVKRMATGNTDNL